MAKYEFVTLWRFKSPLAPVWEMIYNSDRWPAWWKGVERVERVREGDENSIGSVHRYTWKSKLPYRLTFEMELTRVEPMSIIEGKALGELAGRGLWQLSSDEEVTVARYDWQVQTTKAWMNLLTPIARPLFKWNHDVVMQWGAEGLARELGVELIESEEK
ncbi:MAG TPA: SRPBCC family protein [Pyrinomonadaceae bacterium]|nr:SRPBCC family protein [Pyrinomonadaceae bacterium]